MAESDPQHQTFCGASLHEDAATPKHEQLRNYLIAQVESGTLNAGDALPSEHRLAEILCIARSTVRQALANLERSGIVRRIHGKGTFIHEEARQRLKKGQDLFALILPETTSGYYPALQVSFESAAAASQNQIIVCNSNNEIDKQGNSILQLMDLHVAGVAIVPTTTPETPPFHIRQLHEKGIPVVCCSRPVSGVQAPLLAIPFEEIGLRAGGLLRENRHRRVAMLSAMQTPSGQSYYEGFQKGIGQQAQIEISFGTTTNPDAFAQEDRVVSELTRMFQQPHPPTAIFATFDSLAELVYLHLHRMGIRVPEEVSLIGVGGTRRQGALASRLTSVTVDEIRMGAEAIRLLEKMRAGKLPLDSNERHILPVQISNGKTVGLSVR